MSTSHTFAIDAQKLLGGGNASEAVRILEEGISAFPDYTTAYAVLARAYLQMNDTESAFETVQKGLLRFPSHRALQMLDSELRPFRLDVRSSDVQGRTNSGSETRTATDSAAGTSRGDAHPNDRPSPEQTREEELIDEALTPQPTDGGEPGNGAGSQSGGTAEQLHDDALSALDDTNDHWNDLHEYGDEPEGGPEPDTDLRVQNVFTEVDTDTVLKQMNIVGGSVVVNQSLLKRIQQSMGNPDLSVLEAAPVETAERRVLRSSNMRLIPGLEFTPLRVTSNRRRHVRTYNLPDVPPFPVIRGSEMNVSPPIEPPPVEADTSKSAVADGSSRVQDHRRTHLEELAARLERARMPSMTEEPDALSVSRSHDGDDPPLVSDTMAAIYEQQGLTEQAIKAYRQLARTKPERLSYYEEKIARLSNSSID